MRDWKILKDLAFATDRLENTDLQSSSKELDRGLKHDLKLI